MDTIPIIDTELGGLIRIVRAHVEVVLSRNIFEPYEKVDEILQAELDFLSKHPWFKNITFYSSWGFTEVEQPKLFIDLKLDFKILHSLEFEIISV